MKKSCQKIAHLTRWQLVLLSAIVCFIPATAMADWVDLGGDQVTTTVLEADGQRTVIEITVGGFESEQVEIDGSIFNKISLAREGKSLVEGMPDLPTVRRAIIIPDDRAMYVRVLESEYVDLPDLPVAPSKGNLLRSVDPALVEYTFDSVYGGDQPYPAAMVEADDPHILRDYRGMVVQANVFQYTPATESVRVFTRMVIEVTPVGEGKINVLERQRAFTTQDPQFAKLYENHFLNFASSRYTPLAEDGGILIISYDSFMPYVQPLVEWKNQKGIPTRVVPLSVTGSSYTAIRDYIQTAYENEQIGYVLLIGDAAQVPRYGSTSDPEYSLVAGSDSYPDLFIGRFSAEDPTHVQTQVERTIAYERDVTAGPSWAQYGTGIASDEGPGHFGEWDATHMDYIRDDLLGYGYTTVDQIYDPSATDSQVAAALNDGRGIVNYVGHGSVTAWSTTGFNVADVNALANSEAWPFICSVACNNGTFSSTTCFAEAWLRAEYNGEPSGAIATYMSYISQSWDPPMYAQDEAVDLLIADEMRTIGGLWFNGSCEMIDATGTAGVTEFKNWMIFGDPSVCVRTKQAEDLVVGHTGALLIGMNSYNVNVTGVEGALCSLYADGVLYGRATTDVAGTATIAMAEPPATVMTLTLTVTGYNKVTFVDDVSVLPPDGPFLVLDSTSVQDAAGDGDGILDCGEAIELTALLENVGVDVATGVSAVLTSADPYLTITADPAAYPDIAAGGQANGLAPFAITVSGEAPDGHTALLTITATGDQGSWEADFSLPIQAPAFAVDGLQITDSQDGNADGGADPGEIFFVDIKLANAGHSDAAALTGQLTCSDPNIVVLGGAGSCTSVPQGATGMMSRFEIEVLADCPEPSTITMQLQIDGAAGLTTTLDVELTIGDWMDDMESDRGWTVGAADDGATAGIWLRADPVGTEYDGHPIQMEDDHTAGIGTNCYVTGNATAGSSAGAADVDGGKTTLTSPVFKLAGATSASINYWRWYSNSWGNSPDEDWWNVDVTSDGVNWVSLEHTQTTAAEWVQMTFNLGDHITLTDQVQIRFVAEDASSGSLVEAGVDDFMMMVAWPLSTSDVDDETGNLPDRIALGAAYPNPFNPTTTISFDVPRAGRVELAVYDVTGRRVATLVDDQVQAGRHEVTWFGRDTRGRQVASGIYFSRLISGREVLTQKMTLIK